MNKVLITILLVLFPLFTYANQKADEELLESALANIGLIKTRDDLSSTQKLQETLKDLEIIRAGVSDEQFLDIFKSYEQELYLPRNDPQARELVYLYIALNASAKEVWPYSKTREELFTYLKSLSSDVSPELKLITYIMEYNLAELHHQREKSLDSLNQASVELEALPSSSKNWRDIKFFFNFIINMKKLDAAKNQGNLDEAQKLSFLLDKDFQEMIPVTTNVMANVYKKFNLNDFDQRSYRVRETLLEALDYDKFLGKFDEVIRKSNLLLFKLDPYSKNRRLLRVKGAILSYQAQVYAKLGNIPAGQTALSESIKIAIRSGEVPTDFLMDFIKLAIQNNDLKLARFYVNSLEKRLNISDPDVRDILIGLIPILRGYLDGLEANIKPKDELAKAVYLESAAWQEKFYYELLDDKPAYALDVLYALQKNFLDAGDKQMAALYAKVYINKIQEFRSKLSEIKDPSLIIFTDSHVERIKSFSNLFFDIGDFDSSFKCFRIIKENEFLDFVRRRDSPEKLLTKLAVSSDESDYLIQISAIYRQQVAIQKQLKILSVGNEFAKLQEALNKNKSRIADLKFKLAASQKLLSKAEVNHQMQFHEANQIGSGEAFVEIYTTADSINTRVVTNQKISKTFTRKIPRLEFRILVLNIYNAFAKNQSIPSADLEKLSNLVIEDANNFLMDSNINRLKVRVDDFYLNLIPIAQLKINKKDIGEKYSISLVGLNLEGIKSGDGSKNFSAFAATKGNKNFSALPGARQEIEALKNISKQSKASNNLFFIDGEFNKGSLISSFSKNNSIHLATHFQVNGNASESIKMLLGDGSEMSLDEIRKNLPDLNVSLVTLSACDTGNLISSNSNNDAFGGSPNDGLSSVFLTKGARSVIATLWSIDDQATSDFMGIFYTLLMTESINEADALALTQSVFRNQSMKGLKAQISEQQKTLLKGFTKNISKYAHPYYWAGFEIYTVN